MPRSAHFEQVGARRSTLGFNLGIPATRAVLNKGCCSVDYAASGVRGSSMDLEEGLSWKNCQMSASFQVQ